MTVEYQASSFLSALAQSFAEPLSIKTAAQKRFLIRLSVAVGREAMLPQEQTDLFEDMVMNALRGTHAALTGTHGDILVLQIATWVNGVYAANQAARR